MSLDRGGGRSKAGSCLSSALETCTSEGKLTAVKLRMDLHAHPGRPEEPEILSIMHLHADAPMAGGLVAEDFLRAPVVEMERIAARVVVLSEEHALDVIPRLAWVVSRLSCRHPLDREPSVFLDFVRPRWAREVRGTRRDESGVNGLTSDHRCRSLSREVNVNPLLLTMSVGERRHLARLKQEDK